MYKVRPRERTPSGSWIRWHPARAHLVCPTLPFKGLRHFFCGVDDLHKGEGCAPGSKAGSMNSIERGNGAAAPSNQRRS